jgi:hypothetical protein
MQLGIRTVKMEEAHGKKERLRALENRSGTLIRAVCQDPHGLVDSPTRETCKGGYL